VKRALVALAALAVACSSSPTPDAPSAPTTAPVATNIATATATATGASGAVEAPPPTAAMSAAAPSGTASASAAPAPVVADNQVKPISDADELQHRAKLLLDAVAADEPGGADPFWFPEQPFLVLKDIKDPGKYWSQLHHAYANNIHALHKQKKSWDGVVFKRFELGSTPKWVKPGEEANKIGYFRSFHGKIHYELGGEAGSIDVHTVITWQGLWYVTHLSKFK
jgi:hypothetical protein